MKLRAFGLLLCFASVTFAAQPLPAPAHLWDASPTKLEHVAYSPSGKLLLAGGRQGPTFVLDATTGARLFATAPSDELGLFKAAFSHDESLLVELSGGSLKVWDLHAGRLISRTEQREQLGAAYFDLSPSRDLAAEGTLEGTIFVDDLRTGRVLCRIDAIPPVHNGEGTNYFSAVPRFSPDGAYILAPLRSAPLNVGRPGVGVWRTEDCKPLFALHGPAKDVTSIALIPQTELVAANSYDNRITIWDYRSGAEVRTFKNRDRSPKLLTDDLGLSIAVSRDGRQIATGSAAGMVAIWDLSTKTKRAEFYNPEGSYNGVTRLIFSADGQQLVAMCEDGSIDIWEAATGRLQQRIKRDEFYIPPVSHADLSPDGRSLAVGSRDHGYVEIFDLK